jgi:hypothetical protein
MAQTQSKNCTFYDIVKALMLFQSLRVGAPLHLGGFGVV